MEDHSEITLQPVLKAPHKGDTESDLCKQANSAENRM